MKLIEVQKKIVRLIEEASSDTTKITDDVDIDLKLNDTINQVQFELCRIKKIPAKEELNVSEGEELVLDEDLDNFYQLNIIKGAKHEQIDKYIKFLENGLAEVYYYKFPKRITKETDGEKYTFEISDDLIEILVYGVAGDVLMGDASNQYGKIYRDRYNELKQNLDPRYMKGSITVCDDGLDF